MDTSKKICRTEEKDICKAEEENDQECDTNDEGIGGCDVEEITEEEDGDLLEIVKRNHLIEIRRLELLRKFKSRKDTG